MKYAEESERLMRESVEIMWCPVEGSKIADFHKGKNIFVTGATGFVGKLLVEKLLRACPNINTIYILIRPKKGEDEDSRLKKLYTDQQILPNFQRKISVIKGDISLPDLAVFPEDKAKILEQVNVIFNIAAVVRFDEKITTATKINVRGARDLLKIAGQCKHLESFVHVGTAYSNCNRKEIDEIFYKLPITADELIEM
ncbi:NAD binding 4, Epimerase, and/or 3Beta HSD domain containing protein, partial [Asbolus verrucosus]